MAFILGAIINPTSYGVIFLSAIPACLIICFMPKRFILLKVSSPCLTSEREGPTSGTRSAIVPIEVNDK